MGDTTDFVSVSIEPSPEMIDAAFDTGIALSLNDVESIWRSMVLAAVKLKGRVAMSDTARSAWPPPGISLRVRDACATIIAASEGRSPEGVTQAEIESFWDQVCSL